MNVIDTTVIKNLPYLFTYLFLDKPELLINNFVHLQLYICTSNFVPLKRLPVWLTF